MEKSRLSTSRLVEEAVYILIMRVERGVPVSMSGFYPLIRGLAATADLPKPDDAGIVGVRVCLSSLSIGDGVLRMAPVFNVHFLKTEYFI